MEFVLYCLSKKNISDTVLSTPPSNHKNIKPKIHLEMKTKLCVKRAMIKKKKKKINGDSTKQIDSAAGMAFCLY